MPAAVIQVSGMRMSYGGVEAVRGIDLEVREGEVFAFLGPNGAGKTTTVEVLEGYRTPTAGAVDVLGVDPRSPTRAWRERIGIVLQQCRMRPELTVRETLELYAGYYARPLEVDAAIHHAGLGEKAEARVGHLSGGQMRRLDVAVALVGDPDLLFLDEPTTGFDPSARRQAWEVIAGLRELGKTVFLTTHYMDEAQHLADRCAIIARGLIVAEGSPEELGDRERGPATISFRLPSATPPAALPGGLGLERDGNGDWTVTTDAAVEVLHRLTGWALENSIELDRLQVRRPTLEDVYLELTGVGDEQAAPEADG